MKLKIMDLSEHPKLRATLARAVEKNRATRTPLTRKEVLISSVLRRKWKRCQEDGVVFAAHAIADALKRDNPKFNRQQFILAFRGK